ncbi:restriction endonuclease [Asticcacaulis taihuensis]|uniref:Restriction endonuclease type IV Mrr domain-containing protein n=1 Tax=Asticcacaulis taihuensis TaxID=260084 RepID=A0A1G4SVV5_9CAUL|nr:hypothetical protein [Asticcacaulis taihuensis]SCW73300.1 hypothetical protein SAMN02927928_3041 [Asticcacaulis taihuensis]
MPRIQGSKAYYIKLGPGGAWETTCLNEGTLRLGHNEIPHELAQTKDREAIRQRFIDLGVSSAKASDKTRELLTFYAGDESVIWITFSRGLLWWCHAMAEVKPTPDGDDRGARWKRCVTPWSSFSVGGALLHISALSGRLTRTAGYRQNICNIADTDYLLARLNDEPQPDIAKAVEARDNLSTALVRLIAKLSWQDFELFVDLIFTSSGWRRTGALGGTQKTVDIELELPSTNERAFVQVKSATNQSEFDQYLSAFGSRPETRMFYAYHTLDKGCALNCAEKGVAILGPERLSKMALNAGLTDWLIQKAS